MINAWRKWTYLTKKISGFQAIIFLSISYILLILPFSALLKRLSPSSLDGHDVTVRKGSHWIRRNPLPQGFEWGRKQ
jgi:hypothetical protein